jgi:3-deoxy-D-manno-octulosonic-acid transferase
MLLQLYKSAVIAATPLLERHLKKRAAAGKEDPARAHERHGRPAMPRGQKPLVWFHAASVGESLSILSIVARVLKEYPAVEIMVTTGTVTSAKLMAERLPQGAFHQYIPVDHPVWVESFLDHWHPDFAVWAESELWPNMLTAVRRRGIPAVLLNARMSERSFNRWKHAKGLIGEVFGAFSLCLAQNEAEAQRLMRLGAPRVKVSANLKYAAAPLPFDEAKLNALRFAVGKRPLILWASTHPGEDEVALRLHAEMKKAKPDLLTIIVPRHPVRGKDIRALCAGAGFTATLRSDGAQPDAKNDIYIADTMGELGLFYRLSKLAIVGGTFKDIGGHNPIEPGQTGCVIFYGPVMYNFITICEDFESRKAALRVKDEAELADKTRAFLENPAAFAPMSEAAQKWTDSKAHILDELMADFAPYLCPLIEPGQERKAS